jgi:sorbitol/mannitol transport system permease protein
LANTITAPRPPALVRELTRAERWKIRGPLLPALIFTILLTQLPFLLTLIYSFQSWSLLSNKPAQFNGGANYLKTVQDEIFWRAIGNTGVMTGVSTVACIVIGLLLALLLNHTFPGRGIARTLAITPFFVMPVAVTLFWRSAMFDPGFGLLGWFSRLVGLPAVSWLSEYPMAALIILLTWRFAPFAMLILIAGLQSAPQEQLEAARVDGAGPLRQFRFILIPHLRPYIELAALLLAMNLIQTFGEIALLTAGGPAFGTTNITYYIYLKGFNGFDFGTASALGIAALLITIALILPALRLLSGIFQKEGRR